MRAARRQTHVATESFLSETCALSGSKLRAFDPRSFTSHSAIENSGQWQINNSEHALAFFSESDLNSEIAVAVDETVCAVEWIDHPHARLLEPSFCINRFFREYSVVGKFTLETGDDQFVRDSVGLRDGFNVVVVILSVRR